VYFTGVGIIGCINQPKVDKSLNQDVWILDMRLGKIYIKTKEMKI